MLNEELFCIIIIIIIETIRTCVSDRVSFSAIFLLCDAPRYLCWLKVFSSFLICSELNLVLILRPDSPSLSSPTSLPSEVDA